MAAPITHIALTDKIFDKYFKDKDKSAFCVGTVFPDIRFLGEVEREKTHLRISSLEEVEKEQDPFLAGVKFHDFVDFIRTKFYGNKKETLLGLLIKLNILPENFTGADLAKLNRVSKLVEDESVYAQVDNWADYVEYLNRVYKGEVNFGVSISGIRHWHKMLQDYFMGKPDTTSRNKFFLELNWPKERIDKIEQVLKEMKKSKELVILLNSFYYKFEDFIDNETSKS